MNTILKNFFHYIKSQKTATILNILGMSAAFAVFTVIMIETHYDLTYDKGYQDYERIHQLSWHSTSSENVWLVDQEFGFKTGSDVPEIEGFCLTGFTSSEVYMSESRTLDSKFAVTSRLATPGFYEVFKPVIIAGNTGNVLKEKNRVLISESEARKLFGNDNPIGKNLYVESSEEPWVIDAVYKDFPENSSIKNALYVQMPENIKGSSFYGYYLMDPETRESVNEKINTPLFIGEDRIKRWEENPEWAVTYELYPLKDFHLYATDSFGGKTKRINMTLILLSLGIAAIAVAFINFINFSLSMIPGRIKGLNIRKILGADKTMLKLSMSCEGLIISVISFILGLFYVKYFGSTAMSSYFSSNLEIGSHIRPILLTLLIISGLTFLAGWYSAGKALRFNEAMALKDSYGRSVKGSAFRNILIVVQFTCAIILIIFSAYIRIQYKYLQNYSWGIEKENVVYLTYDTNKNNPEILLQELGRNPGIMNMTVSSHVPGGLGIRYDGKIDGNNVETYWVWPVNPDFLDFFGIELLAGNNFPAEMSGREKLIVNEEFLRVNDLTEDVIGKTIHLFTDSEIIGVAKNFNFQSLHEAIKPMAFVVTDYNTNREHVFMKLAAGNNKEILGGIKATWDKYGSGELKLDYLEDNLNQLYKKENNMAKLVGLCGLIIALIAIMGTYGLIVFSTKYRIKEIAIRKVNGSKSSQIVVLLNKNLLKLLTVAFIIAVPVAYTLILSWLENFAYRASVPWWMFIITGFTVLTVSVLTVSGQSLKAANTQPAKILKNE